ncbi:hypothetical protein [Hyphococcus lacteus]|uniref:Uncharacterized protein n=1 Tax=Hyphococcus lacteus TaxID=3143536 RepID=A0ABV3Z4T1_9PROT
MRLVIGLAHSKSRNNVKFNFASASGDSPVYTRDITPDGLRFDRDVLEPKTRVTAIERFQQFGPTAIAELGEPGTWPLIDALLSADDDVRALFIYQGAASYIANALAEGVPTEDALNQWQELVRPLLTAYRRHRNKTVLIERDNATHTPRDFHFACKDNFEIDAEVILTQENPSSLAIFKSIATQIIADHPETENLSSELSVSALRFSQKPGALGDKALNELTMLNERISALHQKLEQSTQNVEQLERKGEENNLLRTQLYRVQSELETRYKSIAFGAEHEKKLKKYRQEIAQLKQDIVKIRSSSSWRITAPIRWTFQSLSGAFRLRNLLRTKRHARLIRNSQYFDQAWYIAKYDDVIRLGADPAEHYIRHGGREGRAPGPNFDSIAYLKANPDIAAAGLNPLVHYLQHGKTEGRALKPMSTKQR